MTDMEDVQRRLSQALDAVNELAEVCAAGVLSQAQVEAEANKLRGAFEVVSTSRGLWRQRALASGYRHRWNTIRQSGEPWNPSSNGIDKVTLSEAVGQALGTASMAWEHIDRAGMFDSTEATRVLEGLMAWLSDWADEVRREANEATAAKMQAVEYHDDRTLDKVRAGLLRSLGSVVSSVTVDDIINQMQNEGILFRERTDEAQPYEPHRGDAVAAWLRSTREAYSGTGIAYEVVDALLDDYREHADTGTPLDRRVIGPHEEES